MHIGHRSFRYWWYAFGALALALFITVLAYAYLFGPAGSDAAKQDFVVSPGESMSEVAARLAAAGIVRSAWAFRLAYTSRAGIHEARPGGYEVAPSMDAWSVANTLSSSPYIAWVVVPPGLRKEQIGDLLASALSWTPSELAEWNATDTNPSPSYAEGVYYPDTYLIPSDQAPAQIAARMRDRFAQAFEPYAAEAAAKGEKWTDVLTLASLIEREAAGPDMKLISGILWNRLRTGMALQVDASLQYVKGNETDGWWPVVKSKDKYLDSPFNTYEHTGLPPHPIANPPLTAIEAVLDPEKTSCIYYLHDPNGHIHCSANYAGQLANVNKYLK